MWDSHDLNRMKQQSVSRGRKIGAICKNTGDRARVVSMSDSNAPPPQPQTPPPERVFTGAIYECVRCGTRTTQEELLKLPEVKCICGYRVFRKARPTVVKQIKAV
jgi:DNA-directed RNA polymerase subunit P